MFGIIGKKAGMTQVFDEVGKLIPVTVIEIIPNVVVARKTTEKDGYNALVLGVHKMRNIQITKPYAGQFPEGLEPTKILREVRDAEVGAGAAKVAELNVGDKLDAAFFEGLRFVDVQAVSKGKGFQGVVKRYGFRGGHSTHGSKFHREPGSTGQSTYPARTFKNVKLPGRMGGDLVTTQNLRVVRIDTENNCILVRGAVPGPRNCTLLVSSAVKKAKK